MSDQPTRRPASTRTRTIASGGVLALAAGLAVAASSLGSAGSGTSSGSGGFGGAGVTPLGRTAPVSFTTFRDCGSLLGYYRSHAGPLVTPYGLPGAGPIAFAENSSGLPVPAQVPAARAVDDLSLIHI